MKPLHEPNERADSKWARTLSHRLQSGSKGESGLSIKLYFGRSTKTEGGEGDMTHQNKIRKRNMNKFGVFFFNHSVSP